VEEGASLADRKEKPAREAQDSAACKAVFLGEHFGLFVSNFNLKEKIYLMR
jgi:hypothetical protein